MKKIKSIKEFHPDKSKSLSLCTFNCSSSSFVKVKTIFYVTWNIVLEIGKVPNKLKFVFLLKQHSFLRVQLSFASY